MAQSKTCEISNLALINKVCKDKKYAFYRKEREHHHIQNMDLVRKGLNGKR